MTQTLRSLNVAIDGLSIVLRGNFNPAIFSPAWLLYQKLIGRDEFDNADTELITNKVATFSAAWATVQVTEDRLQISTIELDEFERVRDLVVGVLNVLPHTPIAALGVNREIHVAIDDSDVWHSIGDQLVPKIHWAMLNLPGMRSLAVEGARPDLYEGRVVVQVEPSLRVAQGIYLAHNDHFELKRRNKILTSRRELADYGKESDIADASESKSEMAREILVQHWGESMDRAVAAFGVLQSLIRTSKGEST